MTRKFIDIVISFEAQPKVGHYFIKHFSLLWILGGNQRDLAREKAAKKAQELARSKGAAAQEGNKGLSLEARKQRYLLVHKKHL